MSRPTRTPRSETRSRRQIQGPLAILSQPLSAANPTFLTSRRAAVRRVLYSARVSPPSLAQGGPRLYRPDGRAADQLRPVRITLGAQEYAEGSVIIEAGKTRVLCAVTAEDGVPQFLRGAGRGWLTAEYAMLPRSTVTRTPREGRPAAIRGRTQEIQRLIGRSLRAALDLEQLGERTLTVDCDVLQADGGTRTAAITGAYVALYQALKTLMERKALPAMPLRSAVAAVSLGALGGEVLLDMCYEEDSRAEADFNVVMTDRGEFVEVQGTAEGKPYPRDILDAVLAAAHRGISQLFEAQKAAIGEL